MYYPLRENEVDEGGMSEIVTVLEREYLGSELHSVYAL